MFYSPLVTYKRISPHKAVSTKKKDTITIHCYVGQVTAKQGCDYFATTTRKASCNYVVGKDGSIGLSVPENYRSFCSSNLKNDDRAITIEVASDTKDPYIVTIKAMEVLIELCADICRRNGIERLVWSNNKKDRVNHLNGCNMTVHRDYALKSCPGQFLYSQMYYIADRVNSLINANPYIKNGIDYSVVFDPAYYSKKYSDLASAGLKTNEQLFEHFYNFGMNEKRRGNAKFNVNAYASYYADLREVFGSDWKKYYEHYISFGIYENRKCL